MLKSYISTYVILVQDLFEFEARQTKGLSAGEMKMIGVMLNDDVSIFIFIQTQLQFRIYY